MKQVSMKEVGTLRQLGSTQQKLLRRLLQSPQGATVEELCEALGVTHNAVRQHLTALIAEGWISLGAARASGGRPRACYLLLPAGRELFPRNDALIARGMIEHLYARAGTTAVQEMLAKWARASAPRRASRRLMARSKRHVCWPNNSTRSATRRR